MLQEGAQGGHNTEENGAMFSIPLIYTLVMASKWEHCTSPLIEQEVDLAKVCGWKSECLGSYSLHCYERNKPQKEDERNEEQYLDMQNYTGKENIPNPQPKEETLQLIHRSVRINS